MTGFDVLKPSAAQAGEVLRTAQRKVLGVVTDGLKRTAPVGREALAMRLYVLDPKPYERTPMTSHALQVLRQMCWDSGTQDRRPWLAEADRLIAEGAAK